MNYIMHMLEDKNGHIGYLIVYGFWISIILFIVWKILMKKIHG